MAEAKVYLGDGVYASFDGYAIKLTTLRGGIEHWLVLEPRAMQRLVEFARRAQGVKA